MWSSAVVLQFIEKWTDFFRPVFIVYHLGEQSNRSLNVILFIGIQYANTALFVL